MQHASLGLATTTYIHGVFSATRIIRVGQEKKYVYTRYFWQVYHQIYRVGQNHIYTVYIRYFWLGNHQIYGVYIRIYTVLANPTNIQSYTVCGVCLKFWLTLHIGHTSCWRLPQTNSAIFTSDTLTYICRVGQNHLYTVYIQYFGREIIKYTVIYGVYIRFWPTLQTSSATNAWGIAHT